MVRRVLLAVTFALPVFAQIRDRELREQYNRTYSDAAEQSSFRHEPNAFLVKTLLNWKPGRALDVGMGQGRNAIWLAKQGWDVTGFDLSDVGVRLANEQAERASVKINAVVANASDFDFGVDRWDLIVLAYMPFASFRDRLIQSLRPGGIVVVESFHEDTRRIRLIGGGFKDNELLQALPGLRVLRYEDVWAKQDWGVQLDGNNRLVRLVAQKPVPPSDTCELEKRTYSAGGEVCWGRLKMRCSSQGWERAGSCPSK